MANFIPNQIYHGFLLESIEEISDIYSKAYLFRHPQSGARLLYLQNKDHNKVFNVAFKTPPENDCGTPHILEHSVLCGSRKYEAKDPFNELAKGSLNTFLNAMTYADKTMYPVASCNEKDFHHLMDVYLDAVFYPKIYEKKAIFLQEGWRYLWKDTDAPLELTGVVYNEMKGALSDPESLLNGAISRSIFGKTTYGFESGGDPAAIPDLSYEDFLAFHRKYYHPSNAYFYLYGDMEPMECLRHIHEGYLSAFTASDAQPEITETICAEQGQVIRETYPATEESGTYFAYNIKVGKCTDSERIMALQILSYVLLETNASPLKTALMNAGICEETEGWFDSSTYEMVFSIIGKNAKADEMEQFRKLIEEECARLCKEGLPKDLLQSGLRKYDFLLREEDYGTTPKGLIYCTRLMKRWLHGEEPLAGLRTISLIEKLKKVSGEGYFEALIQEIFLQNEAKTYVIFAPEIGKAEKEAEKLAQRLAEKKAQFSEAEIAAIREDSEKLDAFQKTVDSPEILAQIPLLEISEVEETPQLIPYREDRLSTGKPILFVPLESNGILYFKLHFDMSALPQALVPYSGLLADLMGKLDTAQYSYYDLPTALNQTFGGFSVHQGSFNKNADEYRAFITAKGKLLLQDLERAMEMIEEILFHTKWDALESMKKIVKSLKISGENKLLNYSHLYGIFYSGSNLFPGMYLEDATSGIRYHHFLCEINKMLEEKPEIVIENLRKTAEILFIRNHLEIAFGCEEKDQAAVRRALDKLLLHFDGKKQGGAGGKPCVVRQKTAFINSGSVVYNILSFDFRKKGLPYHGKYQVLQTIINLEYLWNQVRVQGGAYGCGSKLQRSGLAYFYSYRDPNVKETYAIYEKLAEDLAHFTATERDMTKYILGTINRLDQPKTNIDRLDTVIAQYYKDITSEMLRQERSEILQTTAADIRDCQALLQALDSENICSIGDQQKITAAADLFTEIQSLL